VNESTKDQSTHITAAPKLLEGKRALITGASRGLGRTICETFARAGARVAFTYSSDTKNAAKTEQSLQDAGADAQSFQVSVLDANGMNRIAGELEDLWGGIDILVNNAGVTQPLPVALIEEEDWDKVMDVNAKGSFLVCRAVLRGMMRAKSGTIVNIGSLAGERAIEAPAHYMASKAALRGLTESLCKEMARYNIRVNCVAPGLLEDGLAMHIPDYRVEEYVQHVALGRLGTSSEVAEFVAFLASDRSRYMNGATVLMDGGL
jgi:3-oxoacyl-[acyl-carrier protein] reductase